MERQIVCLNFLTSYRRTASSQRKRHATAVEVIMHLKSESKNTLNSKNNFNVINRCSIQLNSHHGIIYFWRKLADLECHRPPKNLPACAVSKNSTGSLYTPSETDTAHFPPLVGSAWLKTMAIMCNRHSLSPSSPVVFDRWNFIIKIRRQKSCTDIRKPVFLFTCHQRPKIIPKAQNSQRAML